jgi:hypothetical protein
MKEVSSNICSIEWEEQQNIDEMWTNIKNGINEAAEKITGKERKPSRNDWFNEECQTALEEKNKAYKKND